MKTCKNCNRQLIPYKGRCVYCGAEVNDTPETVETEEIPTPLRYRHDILLRENPIRLHGVADFVFCVDCSRSLMPVLDSIKESIAVCMEAIETTCDINWRARVMGYRNFDTDKECLLNGNSFVTTVEALKTQLDGMVAKGFAEKEPSSTLDAIWYATFRSEWRSNCEKFVSVFTNEFTKGLNVKTSYEIIQADSDLDVLSQELDVNRIKLLLCGLENHIYDSLRKIPCSDIIQFKNPIDFYCHKKLDFQNIIYQNIMQWFMIRS